MIIQINDRKCVSSIALGEIKLNKTDKGQHVATAKVVIDGKPPLFMFPMQRLPYTPTGTTYGGKAKYPSYFVPLEIVDDVTLQFFSMLEAHLKRLLFQQRGKLFEKPSEVKNHLAIEAKLTWQGDNLKDDGTPYNPLFQPRLKKEWTKDKQVLPTFDCVCMVINLEKEKKTVKLSETNLGEHLLPNSSVGLIATMREIRVVGNKVLLEMEVMQLVVVHNQPPELQKDTLLKMLNLDGDCAASLASESNPKKRKTIAFSPLAVPEGDDEEGEVSEDDSFQAAAAAVTAPPNPFCSMSEEEEAKEEPVAPPKKKKAATPKKNKVEA